MRFLSTAFTAALLAIASISSAALPQVPQEYRGVYVGKVSSVSYQFDPPNKTKQSLVLEITGDTCSFFFTNQYGIPTSATFTGTAGYRTGYLYYTATMAGLVLGGRLQVKGKPGKAKASGPLQYYLDDYLAQAESQCSLKQLAE